MRLAFLIAVLTTLILCGCAQPQPLKTLPEPPSANSKRVALAKKLELIASIDMKTRQVKFEIKNLGGMPQLIGTSWQNLAAFVITSEETKSERSQITEDGAAIETRPPRPEELEWIMPGETKVVVMGIKGSPESGEILTARLSQPNLDKYDERSKTLVKRDKDFILSADVNSPQVQIP